MERVRNTVRRGDDVTSFITTCTKSIRTLNLALKKVENIGTKVSIQFFIVLSQLTEFVFVIFSQI